MHANRSASQNELKSIAVCITGTFLASYSDSDGRELLSDSKSTKKHARAYDMSFFDIAVMPMDTRRHRI